MLLRLPLAAAILVVATACASRGRPAPVPAPAGDSVAPIPPPPPPATPRGGAREVIRFGPSALRYLVHQQIHVEQEFQGQTSTVDRGIRGYVSAIITGPADSAGYPLTFTVDSIVPDSGTALPPTMNLQTVRGLTLRGRLAPTGEFRDPLPSDSGVARTFAQIIGSFQNFYPRLPAGGLAVGAVWTDTVTTTDRTVVEVTTKSINNARAVDWEQRSGTRCLRLEVNSTYTLAGAGEQGGQVMELAGSGTRSTVQFLAADGRYLGGEVRDSAAIAITLPIQNTTVPIRQVSRSTISVLP